MNNNKNDNRSANLKDLENAFDDTTIISESPQAQAPTSIITVPNAAHERNEKDQYDDYDYDDDADDLSLESNETSVVGADKDKDGSPPVSLQQSKQPSNQEVPVTVDNDDGKENEELKPGMLYDWESQSPSQPQSQPNSNSYQYYPTKDDPRYSYNNNSMYSNPQSQNQNQGYWIPLAWWKWCCEGDPWCTCPNITLPPKRILFAGIIIFLAATGIACGLFIPQGDSRDAPIGGTPPTGTLNLTPAPTPIPENFQEYYRLIYNELRTRLIDADIVDQDSLLPTCTHVRCGGTSGGAATFTSTTSVDASVHQKVFERLLFDDNKFLIWFTQDEPLERFIQRFLMTTLSYLWGANDVDPSSSWTNAYGWNGKQGDEDDDIDECDWYGVNCEDIPFTNSSYPSLSTTIMANDIVDPPSSLSLAISSKTALASSRVTTDTIRVITKIDLANNQLTGDDALPEPLMKLAHLKAIELSENSLEGTIPITISSLSHLERLILQGGALTLSGPIPTEIGSLTSLKSLYLGGNKFTGDIPTTIGNLTNLIVLSLPDCGLTGTLPSTLFSTPRPLQKLYLQNNNLSGSLQKNELSKLTKLRELNLSYNLFDGEMPGDWYKLSELQVLNLSHNKLSGNVKDSIAHIQTLEKVVLHDNNFTGEISNWQNPNDSDSKPFCINVKVLTADCARDDSIEGEVECACCDCCAVDENCDQFN